MYSKNSCRDGQHLGHLVRSVQLFLDQGFLIKGKLQFCREKNSLAGTATWFSQLFESKKFRDYWSTLTSFIS
jgi:hypothetical protein